MKKIIRILRLGILIFAVVSCSDDPASPEPDEDDDPCETPPVINEIEVENTGCSGNDGSIVVEAVGENGGLSYSLDGTTFQQSSEFTELAAGKYTVTVQDQENCQVKREANVGENSGTLVIAVASTTDASCGIDEGSILLEASGGEGEYSFSINGEDFQAEGSFDGLGSGKYTVYARDGNACVASTSVTLLSGISFNTSIAPIINANCAVAGCHVAGTGRPNFSDFDVVKSHASAIMGETQSGNMPPASSGKTLTSEQIEAIACWVNDGALKN